MKFTDFVKLYPDYNKYRFSNENGQVRFLFNGDDYNPFDKNGNLIQTLYQFPTFQGTNYTPENINDFLIYIKPFPKEFKLNIKEKYSIPASYSLPSYKDIHELLKNLEIYVTPTHYITIKTDGVFMLTPPSYYTTSQYTSWLTSTDMKYWSQELNFAVWIATAGCGIGYNMLTDKDNPQISSILRFHVLFTIRRVLYKLACPLPYENNFSYYRNTYSNSGYKHLCSEFNLKNPDFRWSGGSEKINIYWKGGYYNDDQLYLNTVAPST